MDWPLTPTLLPESRDAAHAALLGVLTARGPLSAQRSALMATLEDWLGAPETQFPDASHEELVAHIQGEELRRRLIDAMVIGVLIDGNATQDDADAIAGWCRALAVDGTFGVRAVELLARGHRWRLRSWVMRRFWPLERLKIQIAKRGLLRRMVPFILATVFGLWRRRATRDRYAALRELPKGTLGRELVEYFAANEFPLYGEKGAIDELIVFHDCSHVLSGYGTFPAHEILAAWFMAGFRGRDLPLMLFPLIQFHLGVLLNPVAPACEGLLDPRTALEALLRGQAMTLDLTRDWDFWAEVDAPLSQVRARYNVAPSRLLPNDTHLHPERRNAA